jgi:M6 family metalloprotease-like protein
MRYELDGSLDSRLAGALALGNHLVSPDLVRGLKYRFARGRLLAAGRKQGEIVRMLGLPPGTTGTMPSKGTVRVLALLVSFSDYPAGQSADSIGAKLFGDGEGGWPYESLRNFYRRSSYSQLEISGNVLGWYTPSYTRASMPQTTTARENLIKEALKSYDEKGHDFLQYDNDGNGTVDYFVVIWTGPDNGWGNFWWGYQTSFSDSGFQLDGVRLFRTRYSWQWESRPYPGAFSPRVVIHETGHALGLPDYYDYDDKIGPRGGCGGLDMMDSAFGDHGCFSKFLLDWIAPKVLAYGTRDYSLGASANTPDALIVMPDFSASSPFSEFYMVQNRLREENDRYYQPADGLLIWHVDAGTNASGNFIYNNSYTDHKLLRLMEADGLEEIERGYAADADDYWVQGKIFSPDSRPASRRYDGSDSGLSVLNISSPGQAMTFSADVHYALFAPLGFSARRVENDYIFFKEYINKLSWEPNSKNRTQIVKQKLFKKDKAAATGSFVLVAELGPGVYAYDHRGLKKSELYTYWLVVVDKNGVESGPAEAGN